MDCAAMLFLVMNDTCLLANEKILFREILLFFLQNNGVLIILITVASIMRF